MGLTKVFMPDMVDGELPFSMIQGAPVSVLDFGADPTGVEDSTDAFNNLCDYVNNEYYVQYNTKPLGIYFPQGTYKYTDSLNFEAPVYLFSEDLATLDYRGGSNAINLGKPGIGYGDFDVFTQAAYTVNGLRFTSTNTAVHGIYVRQFVIQPRIMNCVFEDFSSGSGGSNYCIFLQAENWDIIIENCQMFTLNRLDANANFICVLGTRLDGVSDGGQSRATISNCMMTSYNGADLGVYAQISGVKSRLLGGSFVQSSYGILLTPTANDVIIDSVYCEMADNALAYITTSSKTEGGNVYFPQGVTINNAYINFHDYNIPMVKVYDSSVKMIGWTINNVVYGGIVNNQLLIEQNDLGGQKDNIASRFQQLFVPTSADTGYRAQITNPNLTVAEPWSNPGIGFETHVVGTSTYTLAQNDCGKIIQLTGSLAALTVPPSTANPNIPIGTIIYVHNGTGGNQTIVAGSGVTLSLTGTATTGTRTVGANGLARLINIEKNVWLVDGPAVT